jgi:hypothetical protein
MGILTGGCKMQVVTREECQDRVMGMLAKLHAPSKVPFGDNPNFASLLDLLETTVVYSVFDKEAIARQAYEQGFAQGKLEGM